MLTRFFTTLMTMFYGVRNFRKPILFTLQMLLILNPIFRGPKAPHLNPARREIPAFLYVMTESRVVRRHSRMYMKMTATYETKQKKKLARILIKKQLVLDSEYSRKEKLKLSLESLDRYCQEQQDKIEFLRARKKSVNSQYYARPQVSPPERMKLKKERTELTNAINKFINSVKRIHQKISHMRTELASNEKSILDLEKSVSDLQKQMDELENNSFF